MPGKILPDGLIARLMREGKTDGDIVRYLAEHEHITVTRQAISAWRKRRGDDMRPRPPKAMPWKLRPEHRQTEPARIIRNHARLERGDTIPEGDMDRYRRAIARLEETGTVFHYDPDTEQGWFLVPRRKGVDKGIVREPDDTRDRAW